MFELFESYEPKMMWIASGTASYLVEGVPYHTIQAPYSQTWKCKYCGTTNITKDLKCDGCNARQLEQ